MKKIKKWLLCGFLLCLLGGLSACGGAGEKPNGNEENSNGEVTKPDDTPALKEITGVTFESARYTYDGGIKTIVVSTPLPEGVSVTYSNNTATNAGRYEAVATLSGDGYETKILKAFLQIDKATYDMSGVVWEYEGAFWYDGEEKSVTLSGLPDGVTVEAYLNATATEPATYIATATFAYDKVNYQEPVVEALEWRILPNVEQMASAIVDSFGTVPDVWAFLPESFAKENRALATIPDYNANFVPVGQIPINGMGKQLNMVYGELVKAETALGFVNQVYAVMNTVKMLYTQYLDGAPENTKYFEGTAMGITFCLSVGETEYELSATVKSVEVKIWSSVEEGTYGARVQLTKTSVLTYEVGENSLMIASTVLDVSALMIEFVKEEECVLGYIYEYLGKEGLFESVTSAMIEVGETYTTLIGTKGDFIPTAVSRNCEVYRNSDGCLVGTEVREEVTIKLLTATYNTLWYPLNKVEGIRTIKKVDEMSGTNADTIYINGKDSDTLHTTLGGLLAGKKSASRRYDIEFKTMYFWVYNEAEETYESVTAEVPMMFIQEEFLESFEEDFEDSNGVSVCLNVDEEDKKAVEYGYYTLLVAYDLISDAVSFEDVQLICGVKKDGE